MALDLALLRPSQGATTSTGARRTGVADLVALVLWGMLWRLTALIGGAALLVGGVPEAPVGRARLVLGAAIAGVGLLRPWRRRSWWASIWRTQAGAAAIWLLGTFSVLFGPVLLAGMAMCVVEPAVLRFGQFVAHTERARAPSAPRSSSRPRGAGAAPRRTPPAARVVVDHGAYDAFARADRRQRASAPARRGGGGASPFAVSYRAERQRAQRRDAVDAVRQRHRDEERLERDAGRHLARMEAWQAIGCSEEEAAELASAGRSPSLRAKRRYAAEQMWQQSLGERRGAEASDADASRRELADIPF